MVKKIPERNKVGHGAPYQRVGITNNGFWDSTQLDQFAKDTIGMLELAAMYGNAEFARKLATAADEWRAVNQATFGQRWMEWWSSRLRRNHYNNSPHPETGRVHRTIWDYTTRKKYFIDGRPAAAWLAGGLIAGGLALAAPLVVTGALATGIAVGASAVVGLFARAAFRRGRFIPRWPRALNRAMCRYVREVPDRGNPAFPGGPPTRPIEGGARVVEEVEPRLRDRLCRSGKYLGRVTWDWPNQIGAQVVEDGWQHYFEVPVDQMGTLLESRVNLATDEKQFRIFKGPDQTWRNANDPDIAGFIRNSPYNQYPKFEGAIYQILESDMAKAFATARHMTEIADQADQVQRLEMSLAASDALVNTTGRVFGGYAAVPGGPPPLPGPPPWAGPPPGPAPRPRRTG